MINSNKLKIGSSYQIEITGKSNDDCNILFSRIKGDINSNLIEINDLSFSSSNKKCLSGQIKDENGNLISNDAYLYINNAKIEIKDGSYKTELNKTVFNNLDKFDILASAKGYIPKKETLEFNKLPIKYDILLNKNIEKSTPIQLNFDNTFSEKNNNRRKVQIIIYTDTTKHEILLDPTNRNNVETRMFDDINIGDRYMFSYQGRSKYSSCDDITRFGEGIVLQNNIYPINDVIHIPSSETEIQNYCSNIPEVSGKITDKLGNLLSDVKVTLKPIKLESLDLPWQEETISVNGIYKLENIPPIGVNITISKEGYKTIEKNVYLSTSNAVAVDFIENYAMDKL